MNDIQRLRPLAFALGLASLSALPSPARAQSAPGAEGGLDEVIVSARRRGEESLQDVSIAVTVLSSEDLRKSGIVDIAQIAARTPGFTYQEQIGNQQEVVIRGIGTLRLTGSAAEPSVGLFVDEVYIGRRGTASPAIFDLERVEVVRGPQGTLYGKNVVGGAVNLITARPSHETSGRISAAWGQMDALGGKDTWSTEGYVTGSLGERAAGRLAFQARHNEGYSRNILRGEELDDYTGWALRGSLLFTPSEDLTIHLSADVGHNDGNGQSRLPVDDPTLPGPGPAAGLGLPTNDPRESASPWSQWEDKDVFGISGRLDYQLPGGQTLTYLAALRDGDFEGRYSLVGLPSPPSLTDAANGQEEDYQGITQDLRLASAEGGRLSWVTGLYYLREETGVVDNSIATTYLAFLGPGSIGDILDGEFLYDQKTINESLAVYGEASWALSDALSLTLGGRYTDDDKDFRSRSECLDFGQPGGLFCVAPLGNDFWDIRVKESWQEFTPKAGLDWRATEDVLIYASMARGFKGGGWQGKPGSTAAARFPYDPETAWTYELGAKTAWADGRLRANVAAFLTKFDDLQVEQLDDTGLTLIIDNAANAEIQGIELELRASPVEALELWFSGAWTDSEYQDFIDSSGADLSGNELARTPEYMYSAGVEYTAGIGADYELGLRAEYSWQDDMPWGVENTVYEDAYGLLDARIALSPRAGGWEIALYGKNLDDELYRVDTIPFLGDVFSRFGPPRSFGVQATLDF